MSASEKLKVLQARTDTGTALNYGRIAALNELEDALPGIIAVVKAAEICRSEWQMGSILATALDALDEKLP